MDYILLREDEIAVSIFWFGPRGAYHQVMDALVSGDHMGMRIG
jgi:hypothetical protein